MPKYRQLHTKIIDSFDFNEMPNDFTRVVWLLLMVILDSQGRGIFNMAWIRSKMFPLREDVTVDQISASFDWLESRGMIVTYEVDGKSYFYIPTWKTYQSGTSKEADSNIPAPPELLRSNSVPNPPQCNADSMQCNANASAQSDFEPISDFDAIQAVIEQITGLPPDGARAVDAIREISKLKPAKADISNAYDWIIENTEGFRYYKQLVNPTRTAMSIRLQKNGRSASVKEPVYSEWHE